MYVVAVEKLIATLLVDTARDWNKVITDIVNAQLVMELDYRNLIETKKPYVKLSFANPVKKGDLRCIPFRIVLHTNRNDIHGIIKTGHNGRG